MELRTGRHCVFMLHAHLIFITKYRGKVFNEESLSRLEAVFRDVGQQFEVELSEFNGERDHVHLLINYPPKVQLSKLINSLKGVSSRRLKLINPIKSGQIKKRVFGKNLPQSLPDSDSDWQSVTEVDCSRFRCIQTPFGAGLHG